MNDLKYLTHTGDPDTSRTAALQLDAQGRQSLKEAIITLLEAKPRTDDELVAAYASHAEMNRWPLIADLHSVKRRRSELVHVHGVVRDSGQRRLSNQGRKSVVWELIGPAEEARKTIALRGAA